VLDIIETSMSINRRRSKNGDALLPNSMFARHGGRSESLDSDFVSRS
jgi:hypothetical protein